MFADRDLEWPLTGFYKQITLITLILGIINLGLRCLIISIFRLTIDRSQEL